MARLTPDPTFYASPKAAMQAPVEDLAYVVTLNTPTNGAPAWCSSNALPRWMLSMSTKPPGPSAG